MTTGDGSRSSLHVRIASWDDDPPVGGQGVYVRELRTALIERGLTVSTTAGRGRFAVGYRRITGRGHLDLSVALNLSPSPLRSGDPDLIHVSGGPGGLHLLRSTGRPVVYTAHHTYRLAHPRFGPSRALGLVEGACYRRADMVAAVSASTADSVIECGVPRTRVTVISPGVRLGSGDPGGVERIPRRILFVGRMAPEKGPLDAVAAMHRVAEVVPGTTGVVVGGGAQLSEVAAAAGSSPAGRSTVRVLGRLSDEEVMTELRRAEVVLIPSAFEGLGIVALEAMAAGAAVAGYDVVGLRDTVGPHGLLVPFGDIDGLAGACRRLLEDQRLRQELTSAAGEAVRRQRSWSRCAEEFDELYRSVIAAHT